MIIALGLPDHDQIASHLQKLNIRARVIFPVKDEKPWTAVPGHILPVLAPIAGPVVVRSQWGTPEKKTRKSFYFSNGEGQRFGYRGIVFATHFETQIIQSGQLKGLTVSDPNGAILNVGVVFKPENSDGPLSCKVMLCHSAGFLSGHGRFQPVLLHNRHCSDFINTQREAVLFQKADPTLPLVTTPTEPRPEFGSLVTNPFGLAENDPRAFDPPTYKAPKGVVVL